MDEEAKTLLIIYRRLRICRSYCASSSATMEMPPPPELDASPLCELDAPPCRELDDPPERDPLGGMVMVQRWFSIVGRRSNIANVRARVG